VLHWLSLGFVCVVVHLLSDCWSRAQLGVQVFCLFKECGNLLLLRGMRRVSVEGGTSGVLFCFKALLLMVIIKDGVVGVCGSCS